MTTFNMVYREKQDQSDVDDYTAEELARHEHFKRVLMTTKSIVTHEIFFSLSLDIRIKIYHQVLETDDPIAIKTNNKNFYEPQARVKLNLGLMQASKQVHREFNQVLFARVFGFGNLDTLLSLLVQSGAVRRWLSHVDLQLEAGPYDLDLYALQALSEVPLQTLTLRIPATEGPEED
ncbi:unnamed protein product, partial [Aureobasidium uvarum]